jgi:hypothetical protein
VPPARTLLLIFMVETPLSSYENGVSRYVEYVVRHPQVIYASDARFGNAKIREELSEFETGLRWIAHGPSGDIQPSSACILFVTGAHLRD